MGHNDLPIDELRNIYCKYSLKDIAETLFVSSVWLPNIASPLKHLLATSVVATMAPETLSNNDKIGCYEDFTKLLTEIISCMPDFSLMEDYIPEIDWGQVKINHDGRNFKIMYGCELEHTYDFLQLFQVFYGSIRETAIEAIKRDPFQDFQNILEVQTDIINGITSQLPIKAVQKRVAPGHFEIPNRQFWADSRAFFTNYCAERHFNRSFLEKTGCCLVVFYLLKRQSSSSFVFLISLILFCEFHNCSRKSIADG